MSLPWLALDCGITVSWVSFLCMDMICKRFGANASIKVSILAEAINLAVCLLFWLMSLTPGMWGAYYDTDSIQVNDALNATFGGTWYVVFGSTVSMLCSSVVNSLLNAGIGRRLKKNTFGTFALRSYVSTMVGQFVDNFVFATIVSHTFFGWTWAQVVMCSLTGALVELACGCSSRRWASVWYVAGSAMAWARTTFACMRQRPREETGKLPLPHRRSTLAGARWTCWSRARRAA